MSETQLSSLADSIREARQRVEQELRVQAERYEKLGLDLTELRQLHEQIEQEAGRQWEEVSRAAEQALAKAAEEAAAAATELANTKAAEQAARAAEEAAKAAEEAAAKAVASQILPETVLEGVLSAVRNLVTATAPDQVLEALTQEASQLGVRAAIFDVRGKAAWGASAHGFPPALTEKVLHGLIVPLNQDSPFKQVCETAGHVDATAASLKKNRNVLDKLKPGPQAPILLLPIRSGGTVSAILYSDTGETGEKLPVNALKILAEFGGAQIDRLIALSGGFATEEAGPEKPEAEEAAQEAPVAEAAPAEVPRVEPPAPEPPVEQPAVEARAETVEPPAPEPPLPPAVEAAVEAPPPVEVAPLPAPPVIEEVAPPPPPVAAAPPPAPAGFDVTQLSEADQKVHKDAKRFAKLLVSEIELYNKAKVADGRKNHDVYKRLKSDIDRSRQTFEKRFGKALAKQVDYFHDEVVKTLAANDPSALGTEYPGPSA